MGKTTKKNQFIRQKEDSCTLGKGHRELIICPIDYNGDTLVFDSLFCVSQYK